MPKSSPQVGDQVVVDARDLEQLLKVIKGQGYQPVGPTLRDGELVYGDISSVADLPRGWTDRQEGGSFRLQPRGDEALFGYGVGQHSWKQFLFPPRELLFKSRREGRGFSIIPQNQEAPRFAFIGVHPCDLRAMAVKDLVFLSRGYMAHTYQQRRAGALVVAVNCSQSCGTGFCASLGTGPQAASGFDLALTEILQGPRHLFLVEVGTPTGGQILRNVPHRVAEAEAKEAAAHMVSLAAACQGRDLDPTGLKELLYRKYDHPRWDQVAARCLTCGNCTMVCPTCFCHTFEDVTDLTGHQAERWRRQDVCMTVDFSYIHGGSVRATSRSRYRQWLTHKLATWLDQFGCLGCVGCGRCITWCPVAIDLTEEVRAIRESPPT